MFSPTEQICDYWDRLEVSKQPHRVGPRRSIYLPQSREDKPGTSSENRKPPQSQPHNYPDTEKNPYVLVWGSNSQPSLSVVMHALRRWARFAFNRLPFPDCPGPASPWTFALGHQYLSLGPCRRSPGNNGGGVAGVSVAGST